jgi:hypothetical protein
MRLDNTPAIGLTVSQDEKWLLYSQYDLRSDSARRFVTAVPGVGQ